MFVLHTQRNLYVRGENGSLCVSLSKLLRPAKTTARANCLEVFGAPARLAFPYDSLGKNLAGALLPNNNPSFCLVDSFSKTVTHCTSGRAFADSTPSPLFRLLTTVLSITMTETTLTLGCALLAFGPVVSLFALIVSKKAQLVIVVTTSAFFFLLGTVGASFCWSIFHFVGLNGPLAIIIPGVFFQFITRCLFVAVYHRVESIIQVTLHKQNDEERRREQQDNTDASVRPPRQGEADWVEAAKLRLELNDASCGVAAGVGFGGMHAVLLYGTLLASQSTNNVGVLYQDSCPAVPSLVVSALFAFLFSVLDIFWMLFTFFGMRRRLLYHRGGHYENEEQLSIGGWLGNSRSGGNLALLFTLTSHFFASLVTTSDVFKFGCYVSLPAVGVVVLLTAYMFWAGIGRIYMPPAQMVTVTMRNLTD